MNQCIKRMYSQCNNDGAVFPLSNHRLKIFPSTYRKQLYIPTSSTLLIYENTLTFADIMNLELFRDHTTQVLLANDLLTRRYLKSDQLNNPSTFGTPMEHSE